MTMKTKRHNMSLVCKLTDEEIRDRGFEAGQLDQEVQDLEAEFDEAKKLHKAEVNSNENRRRLLLREIRTKQTTRPVECEIEPDFLNLQVRTTRLDTGELVHERPMSEDEKQGRLIEMGVEDAEAGDGAA